MLLSHGADANVVDSQGQTSLHYAASSGWLDIMCLLLEAGADANVANTKSGATPLMKAVTEGKEATVRMNSLYMAACSGQLDIVRLLLEAGANANAADSYGVTSLHIAACPGRLDIMRLLLEAGADPNVAETKSGDTPLMWAVTEGEEAVVRMLLSHGADANAADSYGQTSLYHAACFGRLDIVRLLLEAGADANAADSYGVTSLHIAACYRQLDIVRLLLEAGADPNVAETNKGETPLMRAVEEDEQMMERILLSHGVDAYTADSQGETSLYHASHGQTSLHTAALSGQLDIMRMLLEAGVDLNVAATEEMKSFTALHYSCDRLRTEMITHLLKHGADPNLVDCNKRTPLAIIGSQAEAGADPNVTTTKSGETPLMKVMRKCEEAHERVNKLTHDGDYLDRQASIYQYLETCSGRLDIMRLLLEAGADPNVADTDSRDTPLMMAMLLSHGADANAADSYGWTSLYDAARSGRLDIMRLLLEAGADPNVADTSGETPMMMAVNKVGKAGGALGSGGPKAYLSAVHALAILQA
ncbi:PREDICTED: putative ankyrin repeat protein RF_0381 [Priapulus caudatus]|uniref:Ankyrin repeat protein RF_0381 n=1 Tax=Priapulus caudatus TaxID=37621 RepID=A0ABM1F3T5_PRICU|nr:PREDICTED: putative ankyrin repeat protein RF_0381 [Priapulus caudatus]